MQITKNATVSIHYTLKNDEGVILDTSEGRDPLAFEYGVGQIIPGLEAALEGVSCYASDSEAESTSQI